MGKRGLLAVAYGGTLLRRAVVRCAYRLSPLAGLAPLDRADAYYETRMIKRMQLEEHNAKNAALRFQATLGAWTKVAAACKLCCSKTAPLLSRMIFEACDLRSRGIEGGYFDGPRAWMMLLDALPAEDNRSKQDKAYHSTRLLRNSKQRTVFQMEPRQRTLRLARCSFWYTSSPIFRNSIHRSILLNTSST